MEILDVILHPLSGRSLQAFTLDRLIVWVFWALAATKPMILHIPLDSSFGRCTSLPPRGRAFDFLEVISHGDSFSERIPSLVQSLKWNSFHLLSVVFLPHREMRWLGYTLSAHDFGWLRRLRRLRNHHLLGARLTLLIRSIIFVVVYWTPVGLSMWHYH